MKLRLYLYVNSEHESPYDNLNVKYYPGFEYSIKVQNKKESDNLINLNRSFVSSTDPMIKYKTYHDVLGEMYLVEVSTPFRQIDNYIYSNNLRVIRKLSENEWNPDSKFRTLNVDGRPIKLSVDDSCKRAIEIEYTGNARISRISHSYEEKFEYNKGYMLINHRNFMDNTYYHYDNHHRLSKIEYRNKVVYFNWDSLDRICLIWDTEGNYIEKKYKDEHCIFEKYSNGSKVRNISRNKVQMLMDCRNSVFHTCYGIIIPNFNFKTSDNPPEYILNYYGNKGLRTFVFRTGLHEWFFYDYKFGLTKVGKDIESYRIKVRLC